MNWFFTALQIERKGYFLATLLFKITTKILEHPPFPLELIQVLNWTCGQMIAWKTTPEAAEVVAKIRSRLALAGILDRGW